MWKQADTKLSELANKVPLYRPTHESIAQLQEINRKIEQLLKQLKPL
jgi:hypothetical protein